MPQSTEPVLQPRITAILLHWRPQNPSEPFQHAQGIVGMCHDRYSKTDHERAFVQDMNDNDDGSAAVFDDDVDMQMDEEPEPEPEPPRASKRKRRNTMKVGP